MLVLLHTPYAILQNAFVLRKSIHVSNRKGHKQFNNNYVGIFCPHNEIFNNIHANYMYMYMYVNMRLNCMYINQHATWLYQHAYYLCCMSNKLHFDIDKMYANMILQGIGQKYSTIVKTYFMLYLSVRKIN